MIGFYAAGAMGSHVAPGTWTPADLSAPPAFWFDPESGITDPDAPLVNSWHDRSGNGWDISASGGQRPTLQSSPWHIDFPSGDYFNFPSGALSLYQGVTSAWVFAVFQRPSADGGNTERPVVLFTAGSGTGARVAMFAGGAQSGAGNRIQFGGRRLDGDSFDRVDSSSPHSGAWVMALGLTDYSSRTIDLYVDGALDASKSSAFTGSGATSDTASARARVAANGTSSPTTYLGGYVRCIMGGVSLPDSDEIDRIFGWAAHELGVTSQLPDGHPYKTDPPDGSPSPATVESLWVGAQS